MEQASGGNLKAQRCAICIQSAIEWLEAQGLVREPRAYLTGQGMLWRVTIPLERHEEIIGALRRDWGFRPIVAGGVSPMAELQTAPSLRPRWRTPTPPSPN